MGMAPQPGSIPAPRRFPFATVRSISAIAAMGSLPSTPAMPTKRLGCSRTTSMRSSLETLPMSGLWRPVITPSVTPASSISRYSKSASRCSTAGDTFIRKLLLQPCVFFGSRYRLQRR